MTDREAMQATLDAMVSGQFVRAGEILLAALAQPERKPLTEEEVYALVDATLEHGRCALARALERAHGIE